MRSFAALATLMLVTATPAKATWLEAGTKHFVIQADTSEKRLRDFATRLEHFDTALRMMYGVTDDPIHPANRVHVFAISETAIGKVCGTQCLPNTVGFSSSRPGGSVIYTATLNYGGGAYDLNAQGVLLFGYSSIFLRTNFPGTYPLWYSLGFSQVNSNALFEPDGSIAVGIPPSYQADTLINGSIVPIRRLLDTTKVNPDKPQEQAEFYARSWALLHYLTFSSDRRQQLAAYLRHLREEKSTIEAAKEAFGDLDQLGSELNRYLQGRKFQQVVLTPQKDEVKVDIRPLSAGAVSTMPVRMRYLRGIDVDQARDGLPEAQQRAAPYPNDPRAQADLAEAELDANNYDASMAAADRALTADPANLDALFTRSMAASQKAKANHITDPKQWDGTRKWLAMANHADPDAVLPLLGYYLSYRDQGVRPPPIAKLGLQKAQLLSPDDAGVRWWLAASKLDDHDAASARELLLPYSYRSEAIGKDSVALQAIKLIDAGKLDAAKSVLERSMQGPH